MPTEPASPQVIPEGAGPVKSVGRLIFLSSTRCGGAPMRRRSPGSGGARPRSGRRALTASPFGASCSGCRGRAGGLLLEVVLGLVDVARISAGVSGRSRRLAARSSLRRDGRGAGRRGRHDGVRQSGRSGQSAGSTSPPRVTEVGVMTCTTRDRPEPWGEAGLIPPPVRGGCRARTWWSRNA